MFRYLRRPGFASSVAAILDQYFSYNSLLINGETLATPFTADLGPLNTSVTSFGSTRNDSFNPFSAGYYSNSFSGSTDYLNVASNASLALGTADFTVEAWVFFNSVAGTYVPFLQSDATGSSATNKWFFALNASKLTFGTNSGGSYNVTTPWTPSVGVWYHVAAVRASGVTALYINGVAGTVTGGATGNAYTLAQNGITLAAMSGPFYLNGYLASVRVIAGTAQYTGAFTPSAAPLTAVSGTVLLACQSASFRDVSPLALGVTPTGTPKVTPVTPFVYTPTAGSAYFNGSTDYLTTSSVANLAFGTGDFTLECWIYPLAISNNGITQISTTAGGFAAGTGITLSIVAGKIQLNANNGGIYTGAASVPAGTWTHVAAVRSSGTTKLYTNGLLDNVNLADSFNYTGTYQVIGGYYSASYVFNGYISNLRVVKGTAVYTANFTPSSVAPTAISGTSLLTLQGQGPNSNLGFIDSSANAAKIVMSGTVIQGQLSPFSQSGWSGQFSGTSYLTTPPGSFPNISSAANYTIEAWVNVAAYASSFAYLIGGTQTAAGCNIFISNTGALWGQVTNTAAAPSTANSIMPTVPTVVPLGVWTHVAMVRNNGTVTLYCNGAPVGSMADTTALASSITYIGTPSSVLATTQYSLNGLMSNARIVVGLAVYTSSFTPSLNPLAAISGAGYYTSLLTLQGAYLKDNSPSNYKVTNNGVSIQPMSPFGASTSWTNAANGGSIYINKGNSALTLPANTAYDLGAGDFTIDCWINVADVSGFKAVFSFATDFRYGMMVINDRLCIYASTSGSDWSGFISGDTGSLNGKGNTVLTANQWYHVAFTRNGNIWNTWINGVMDINLNLTGTLTSTAGTTPMTIGSWGTSPATYQMSGYISNFRINKGVALYQTYVPATAAFANSVAAGDSNFGQVALLIHGDGSNGATNNTFLDSSTNAATVTIAAGTPTQGPFSPFASAGFSNYFAGSGNKLVVASSAGFGFGTGDFTIEAWVFCAFNGAVQEIVDGRTSDAAVPWAFGITATGSLRYYDGGTVRVGGQLTANAWNHVAHCRASNVNTLFVNGVAGYSYTASQDFGAARPLTIGDNIGPTSEPFIGYISNLRIVKGTAVYPAAGFVVPKAALTAIVGTTLLTCQSPRFLDNSFSNVSFTVTGTPSVQAFSPFAATEYAAGTNGGSLYFKGGDDYATLPASSNWVLTEDYTIEAWVYPLAGGAGTDQNIFGTSLVGSNYQFAITPSATAGRVWWNYAGAGGVALTTTANIQINSWTHVAVARSGTTLKAFVNGVQVYTGTQSGSIGQNSIAYVGRRADGFNFFNGYISGLRVVSGTCVYPGAFTPPLAPATAVTNTKLLLSGTNSGILDTSGRNDLVTIGNPQISTAFSKFGTGSLKFNGTTDYLSSPASVNYSMGTADFTIECWVYPLAYGGTTAGGALFQANSGATNGYALMIGESQARCRFTSNGTGAWGDNVVAAVGPALNVWSHMAVVRNGTSLCIYVNGVIQGSTTIASTFTLAGINSTATVGYFCDGSVARFLNGYIDELRVTKGVARYKNSFIVPTAPSVPVPSYTQVLISGTNTGLIDCTGKNVVQSFGTVASSRDAYKFGNSSIRFSGVSGDYIALPLTQNLNLGTQNFTIEMWYRPTAHTATQPCLFSNCLSSTAGSLALYAGHTSSSTTKYQVMYNGLGTSSWIVSTTSIANAGTWQHLALVRVGGSLTLYVDGVANGTANIGTAMSLPGNGSFFYIGNCAEGFATDFINGYIDDFRVTKGIARYTSNFTVPAVTFPDNSTSDPLFSQVTLLLRRSSTTSYSAVLTNNNTVIDSSANALAVNRIGTATQGTFSPFSDGGWSGYFNGDQSYTYTAANAALGFGTGDFTLEAWIYCTANPANGIGTLFDLRTGGTATPGAMRINASRQLQYYDGAAETLFTSLTVALDVWTHVAYVRSGTTVTGYINGAVAGTVTSAADFGTSSPLVVGANYTLGYSFNGYISNVRVVKGVAVYTGAFTPPTSALTATQSAGTNISAISGSQTSILTLQDGRFRDNSVNSLTVTGNTTAAAVPFSPFNTATAYDPAVNGGSFALPASTDNVYSTTGLANFAFGTGDFTVEAWVYQTSTGLNVIMPSAGANTWGFLTFGNNFYWQEGGANVYTTGAVPSYQWVHLAVSRSNSVLYRFVNGVLINSNVNTYNHTALSNRTVGNAGTGYVSNVRVVKGTALYTASFSVPTAPLAVTGGTAWLLNGVGSGILDSSGKNDIVTVGSAATQTSVVKYGTGAIAFNGTTDSLRVVNTLSSIGNTGDFTVEAWVYTRALGGYQQIIANDTSGGFAASLTPSGNIDFGRSLVATDGTSSNAMTANSWNHVAWSRSNGTLKLFINGVQGFSAANATAYVQGVMRLGSDGGGSARYFNGYMADFRVTKGIARYTTNFTAPTAALPSSSAGDSFYNRVTLLLQGNSQSAQIGLASNNVFLDSSSNSVTVSPAGTPSQGKFSPFGTSGGSMYFNGSTDNLGIASGAGVVTVGTVFTFECWVYRTTSSISYITGSGGNGPSIGFNTTTSFGINVASNWVLTTSAGVCPALNTWAHIAVVRTGLGTNQTQLFLNGVVVATGTVSGAFTAESPSNVACAYGGSAYFAGYISNLRIVKGTAVYTGAFTPPTAPLTAIANTQLLLKGEAGSVTDVSGTSDIQLFGGAQIGSISKFGAGSLMLNGTTDCATAPAGPAFRFSGDFTVECWINQASVGAANSTLFDFRASGSSATGFTMGINTSRQLYVYTGTANILLSADLVALNTWTHIAYARKGSTNYLAINGVGTAIQASSTNYSDGQCVIGRLGSSATNYFSGYIEDIRITNGSARYTGNVTPPTAALPTQQR